MIIAKFEKYHETDVMTTNETEEDYDISSSKNSTSKAGGSSTITSNENKVHNRNWMEKLEQLKEFKKKYGHTNVPRGYKPNVALANWVFSQRKEHRKCFLPKDRFEKLEEIGFIWEPNQLLQKTWENNFEELKAYTALHGSCNNLTNWRSTPETQSLAQWLDRQRKLYGQIKNHNVGMTEQIKGRFEKLESLGFMKSKHKRITEFETRDERYHHNSDKTYKSTEEKVQVLCRISEMFQKQKAEIHTKLIEKRTKRSLEDTSSSCFLSYKRQNV